MKGNTKTPKTSKPAKTHRKNAPVTSCSLFTPPRPYEPKRPDRILSMIRRMTTQDVR
jgi:hypothetical protein